MKFAIKSKMMLCRYSVGRSSSSRGPTRSRELEAPSQACLGPACLSPAEPSAVVPHVSSSAQTESGSEVPTEGNVRHVLMCPFKNKVFFQLLVTVAGGCLVIVIINPSPFSDTVGPQAGPSRTSLCHVLCLPLHVISAHWTLSSCL